MRRYTATVACCGFLALTANAGADSAERRAPELVADSCIDGRIDSFVEEARGQQAVVRAEVRILDDECSETIQIVLWETPEGRARATALMADHVVAAQHVEKARSEQPQLTEASLCNSLPLITVTAGGEDEASLAKLIARLRELRIPPVLEPLLILHGLKYDLRIESGISEATFSFHAPGNPRPPQEALHPLDRWSQELFRVLGVGCRLPVEEQPQPGGTSKDSAEIDRATGFDAFEVLGPVHG